jgi:hypothetical protein
VQDTEILNQSHPQVFILFPSLLGNGNNGGTEKENEWMMETGP